MRFRKGAYVENLEENLTAVSRSLRAQTATPLNWRKAHLVISLSLDAIFDITIAPLLDIYLSRKDA